MNMYNHTFTGWFTRKGEPIADTFEIKNSLGAYGRFSNYGKTEILPLENTIPVPPKPEPKPDPKPVSSDSSDSSKGGSSVSDGDRRTTDSTSSTVSVTTAAKQAETSAKAAIEKAIQAGEKSTTATVAWKNVEKVSPKTFQAIAQAAAKVAKNTALTLTVHSDVVKNGVVQSRLYIDPIKAAALKQDLNLGVQLGNTKVENHFGKFFSNKIAIIEFKQTGSFGMTLDVAAKANISGMDVKNLVFYSYNAKTNSYTQLTNVKYSVDANGYLRFSTDVGGSIIVSDKALNQK